MEAIKGERAEDRRAKRAHHVYDVPKNAEAGFTSVTLVELTAEEELQATRRARGDVVRVAYELAKQCLVAVDGKHIGLEDGTVDEAWAKMGPKLRTLIMTAYAELHTPAESDAGNFLKSRRVRLE